MKWENLKNLLTSPPEKLSPDEIQKSTKIVFPLLSIFILLPTVLYFFLSGSKLDISHIITLSSVIFAFFTFLGIAFRKNIFSILKIFALLIFVLSFGYLGLSNPTVAKIGWLGLLGWIAYFIREISRLTRDFKK